MPHRTCYAIAATTLTAEASVEAAAGQGLSTFTIVCGLGSLLFAAMGCGIQVLVHAPELLERGRFIRKFFHHKVRIRLMRAKEPAKP